MQMTLLNQGSGGAGMTIRRRLLGWFRFLWVGILAVGVLAGSWQPTWDNHIFREAILGFLLISIIGVFGFGFRCPRCRGSFVTRTTAIWSGRPCECRKCGISIDEPRET
jgi:hypothetical protein